MVFECKKKYKCSEALGVNRGLCVVVMAFFGAFSLCSNQLVFCDIRGDYRKCVEKKAILEREISRRNKDIGESRNRGLSLKRGIDQKAAEILSTEAKLNETRNSIDRTQKDIQKLEEDREKSYKELGDVLSRGYRSSDDSGFGVILNFNASDKDLDDCIFCNSLGDYGRQIVNDIQRNKVELENKCRKLREDKSNEENLKAALSNQKSFLEKEEQENAKNTNKMLREQNLARSKLSQIEVKRHKLEEQLSRMQVEHSKNSNLVRGSGRYIRPVSGPITSPYGWRRNCNRMHKGLDIGASYGAPVRAAMSGTVIVVGYDPGGWGKYVMIDHGSGYATLYAHLASVCVSTGQSVKTGQIIGRVGMTGRTDGPHLHFETIKNGVRYDPMSEL